MSAVRITRSIVQPRDRYSTMYADTGSPAPDPPMPSSGDGLPVSVQGVGNLADKRNPPKEGPTSLVSDDSYHKSICPPGHGRGHRLAL